MDLPLLTYHREHVRVVDGAVLGFRVLYVLPVHCSGNSQSEVRSKHVDEHTSADVHHLSSFKSMFIEVLIEFFTEGMNCMHANVGLK